MPVLNANTNVQLGPFARGAELVITNPASDAIADFPELTSNGRSIDISIAHVPKKVTLAKDNTYILTARAVAITYQVQ
ncbi:MAG: hypothetical protein ACRBHB_23190 [Arenicella sp.]